MGGFPESVEELVNRINGYIINPILALLFSLALVYFLWGGVTFLMSSESSEARKKGKQHMFWGIIGMFVMVSVYAILLVGLNTFGVTPPADLPLNAWL